MPGCLDYIQVYLKRLVLSSYEHLQRYYLHSQSLNVFLCIHFTINFPTISDIVEGLTVMIITNVINKRWMVLDVISEAYVTCYLLLLILNIVTGASQETHLYLTVSDIKCV